MCDRKRIIPALFGRVVSTDQTPVEVTCKHENELPVFQLSFVTVSSLACFGSIFLARKISPDDGEVLATVQLGPYIALVSANWFSAVPCTIHCLSCMLTFAWREVNE